MKTLIDRKESSHIRSTDYDAEITPQGGALATFEDRVFPLETKIGLQKQKKS
jgi:hypothetical protein